MVANPKLNVVVTKALLKRARDIVTHLEDDGLTLSRLVRDALERELTRLEKKHGPIPKAKKAVRRGRPMS